MRFPEARMVARSLDDVLASNFLILGFQILYSIWCRTTSFFFFNVCPSLFAWINWRFGVLFSFDFLWQVVFSQTLIFSLLFLFDLLENIDKAFLSNLRYGNMNMCTSKFLIIWKILISYKYVLAPECNCYVSHNIKICFIV